MIELAHLQKIMPTAGARLDTFRQPLSDAMDYYGITSARRQAYFLAQAAHESEELKYLLEQDSGERYEGRVDLGNNQPGDGPRFKGRGIFQVTGRHNYLICGGALGLDLTEHPELLEQPEWACRSAAWFWSKNGLNGLADNDSYFTITKLINGGYNNGDSRFRYACRARAAFGLVD